MVLEKPRHGVVQVHEDDTTVWCDVVSTRTTKHECASAHVHCDGRATAVTSVTTCRGVAGKNFLDLTSEPRGTIVSTGTVRHGGVGLSPQRQVPNPTPMQRNTDLAKVRPARVVLEDIDGATRLAGRIIACANGRALGDFSDIYGDRERNDAPTLRQLRQRVRKVVHDIRWHAFVAHRNQQR